MDTTEKLICPRCAEEIKDPHDDWVWFFDGRLYCSEKCCREVATHGR